jgi:hypothetical protein
MSPIRPNVIWAMGFQFDNTVDGRTLKMLNVIDEFTREALAIEVDRAIDADGVVAVMDNLALQLRSARLRTVRQRPRIRRPRCLTAGADSTAPIRYSSAPPQHGRTPGSNCSTADCATSCSTHGGLTRSWRPV